MGTIDLPFDLNSLMTLQFDTLKHAIEWLASQQKAANKKISDLQQMEYAAPRTPPGEKEEEKEEVVIEKLEAVQE